MQRYFLELAYNGAGLHGWQVQPGVPTVQQHLQDAIGHLLKAETSVIGCGRTDTGVHARQYFAHFDAEGIPDGTGTFLFKLNEMIPPGIVVRRLHPMVPNAHARFSAKWRSYEYAITSVKDPFVGHLAWRCRFSLDVERMNRASALLIGERDFTCFCKAHGAANTGICHVTSAHWVREGDLLLFRITANRFLRNMVRAIVGTLVDIGRGRFEPGHIAHLLETRSRSEAGTSAPAQGLFLKEIVYPEGIFLGPSAPV